MDDDWPERGKAAVQDEHQTKGARLGWGLIGASAIAHECLLPALRQHAGSKIVGVYSTDRARGAQFAEAEGAGRTYGTLDEMLADAEVQAVYVSTTNDLHRDQVVRAARAGKHVLCEKPLALALDDARAMVEACRAAGVVFATGHHIRNAGSIRLIRELVQSGRIGRPLAARVFMAGYLPKHLQGWRLTNPEGGGAIMDLTVHDVDTLRFVLQDEPEYVVAQRQEAGMASGGVEDGAMSIIRFRSGLIAQLHDGFTFPFGRTGLEVHGTTGSIYGTDVLGREPLGRVVLRDASGDAELPFDTEELYLRQVRTFVDAVQGSGTSPACTGEDGLRALETALAIREAALTGARVRVS